MPPIKLRAFSLLEKIKEDVWAEIEKFQALFR